MPWLRQLFSLISLVTVVLALSSAVLPQQAEAQIFPSVRNASAPEGERIVFTVELSARVNQDVVLGFTTRRGTARARDFIPVETGDDLTVTIPAGELSATFFISGIQDSLVEGNETFQVVIASTAAGLPPFVTLVRETTTATGTILDDDDAAATISITASDPVFEGQDLIFTVSLDAPRHETLTLPWTPSGTARGDVDYTLPPHAQRRVTIPMGQRTATISLPTVFDNSIESPETVVLTLTVSQPRITVAQGSATGTIMDHPATVSVVDATAVEGETLAFEVRLSEAVGAPVTVDWTASSGTATLNSDLANGARTTGTATIMANTTTARIELPTRNDNLLEGDETLTVALANAKLSTGAGLRITGAAATGRITDGTVRVSLTPASPSATEGGSFNFTVNLSAPVSEDVNLTWTATGGPGDQEHDAMVNVLTDLAEHTGTLTISKGSTFTAFTIRSVDDELFEFDESFRVRLTANGELPDGVAIDPRARTSFPVIRDNDEDRHRIVLVRELSTAISARRTGVNNVGFRIHRGNTGDEPLIVNVVPKNGTATAGEDFRAPSRQVIVPAHTSTFSGHVSFIVIDDSITEILDETYTAEYVVVSSHDVGFLNGDELPDFPIRDNDSTRVSLIRSASAVEGDMIVFTAELDNPVAKPFELTWTATDGTAMVAEDLGKQSGTVTVPAFSRTATIRIPIVNDDDSELDETFTVTLTGIDGLDEPGAQFGIGRDRVTIDPNANSATGTIPSNDESLFAYFQPFPAQSIAIVEGDQGRKVREWLVNRDPASSIREAAFTWSTVGGTAVADQDFVAVSNQPTTLFAGFSAIPEFFHIRGDTIVEADETFTIEFTPAAADFPFKLLPDGTRRDNLSVTITDDDNAVVSLQPTAAAGEGDGTITFTVELDNPVAEQFSLAWTATDGTATVVDDLGEQSGTVTVPALARTATFTIAVVDDEAVEPTENFTVRLSGEAADLVDIDPGKITIDESARDATGTITDNDGATVSISPSRATEPEGGTFTFRVTLGEPVAEDVTVAWTAAGAGGNAATLSGPGSDLADGQDTSGTVTIRANTTTEQTIAIATRNDTRDEGSETFTVTLSEPPATPLPDGVEFATGSATATITDDDDAIVSISPAQAAVEEGDPFTFTLSLSRAQSSPVTMIWTAGATGANPATLAGPDSDLGPGQDIADVVTFPANTTEQTITIDTRNDARVEADETFIVTVGPGAGGLPDGVRLGTTEAAATITDNDEATVSIGNASAAENAGPARFTVSLSQAASRDVVLGVTYAAGSADPAADLGDDRPATVTIAANTTSAILAVPLNDDEIVEGAETFTVTLSADNDNPLPDGVSIPGGTAAGVGTITEDDTATVAITQATAAAAEGSTFTFMAGLSGQVNKAVTVRWTATGTGANAATVTGPNSDLADGQPATGTVTFTANDTVPRQFTITTRNDTRDEGSETFTVTLSQDTLGGNLLPDGVSIPSAGAAATATITDRESGSATVSIFPPAATQPEGNPFAFEVRLSRAVEEPVTVTWTAAGSGGNAATVTGDGSDLADGQDITSTVTFTAGDTAAKTVTIATIDDDRVEGTETFTVRLTGTLPDGVEFATSSATATITETDAATVTLSPLSPSVAEGGTFTFTATLSASVSEPVTVRWTATDGTATVTGAGSDLASGQATTGTVEFAADSAANATQTFMIATNNDDLVEGSETFTVSLAADSSTPLPDGVTVGSADEATATITETDAATVTLSPLSPSVAEGGTFTFTATLTASVSEPVTVRWTAASGTATVDGAGSDLASGQATTATVTFPADSAANATQTFTIATNNDDLVEGSETFTVTLSPDDDNDLPDGVTVGADDEATATITETDAATVTLSPLSPSVAEGGTFTFTATLNASVSEPVTVRWTATDGTATVTGAGSDLASGQATTGTVEFAADSAANTTRTFTIATNNDDLVEGSETFTVSLAADDDTALPDGVTVGDDDEATATITETDAATVSLSPLSPSVAEGGTFTFTATLSASVSEPVTVRWTAASGTATVTGAGSDLGTGQDITATVTFPADSAANATQTFTIATNNDDLVEGSETFTVSIAADSSTPLPDGVTVGSADEATATITETDAATVSLSPLSPSAAEGGTFTFTATLSASVSEPVTVRWTAASGTATVTGAGSDLGTGQATTATVTFPADSAANATQTFTIATNNDDLVEGSETFTVTLSPDDDTDLPDGVTVGSADEATATITETDAATVTLSPLSPSVAEGGTFTFTATLSASVSEPVTVRWTAASGTATVDGAGSDLGTGQDITNTVTFPADSAANATQTFTIATNNDDLVEGSETFTVTLSPDDDTALPDGVTVGADDEATATITETDAATVTLSPLSPSVAEGGTFTFTATLSASVSEPVTVRWTAASGTATVDGAGSDLGTGQATTATVTFPADSAANATQTFTIATNNDDLVEGSETFTVSIAADSSTPLPDGVEIGSADEATATITETDAATVSLSPLSPSVAEGGTFTFTATLSASVSEPVTVRWTAAAGTATVTGPNSDLASGQATTATVTFPADSAANATQTFTIATNNDDLVEGSETFTVSLAADDDTALPDGVTVGDDDEATATITETDAATVTLSPLSPSVAEGGTFTFTATLSASVSEPVTVRWTAASGTATVTGAGSDLGTGQDITATVTFPADSAANATQTFTIATNNDDLVEGSETFTVSIAADSSTPLPDGVTVGSADEATATITETDAATVSLSPLSPSAAEGGTFTFTATLSASVSEPVTVRWTAASGTATVTGAGSDLGTGQATTATVTFPADSAANATQTFTIATNNDDLVEGSETFTVSIAADDDTALPDGVTVGADDEATATITETDAATVSLSPLSPSAAEGGTFTFTATLSAPVSEPVTVRWTAASGTATVDGAGSDLASGQATTATVTFPADSAANATQTFTIATANDTLVEGSETFTVSLAADDDNDLPDGVTVGSADEATATITETDAATVTLSPLSPSVAEGGTFTFTATLSAPVSEPVTVRWTAASGTATVDGAGSDLASGQATTATVVFPANSAANATQTFTIATANDTRVEGSETFTVSLAADDDTALPDGVTVGADDEATATITETDAATVTLSPLSPSVAEGGTFTFTATLSASVSEPVTVRWTAASGTATVTGPNSDLASGQATTATVVFPADSAANATQTFTIATNNDDLVEGSETFTVSLAADDDTALPDGVTVGADDEATATITETDAATVTLSPLSPSVAEGGTFTFTATLSASVSEPVTVRWTAASGTATVTGAGSDLGTGQATTATVTFPADSAANATQTFTIATNNDDLVEGSETFTVTLGEDTEGGNDLPDGVTVGADDEATATITETDAATVTLSPLSPSVAEGGTFTFTATLSASVSEPVTVRWTAASGTATVDGAGSDLGTGQATTATVTFPANSAANATQTFTIATNNDDLVEGSETFTVSIAADSSTPLPDGVEIGSADEAEATITETDAATVTLSPLSPSVAEGGTFTFTATLSASVSEPVTVRWTATDGTATVTGAGSDLASGQATTGTVEFAADSAANATQTFMIATNNDDLVEGSETFTVSLAADSSTPLPDGVTVGSADEATATITETDAATVTLSPLSPSVAEGGTFTFTATLTASVSEPVTVRWTAASGTATVDGAGSDLGTGQDITATVTFPANSAANATQTFTIVTNNDDLVEGSETFTVTLSTDDDTALPDGVTVGADDEATATITETDAATVTLSPLSPSVAEGGTFTFTATLNASVSEPVTVRWTATDGTATVTGAGSDLASGQATTGTVEFAADSAANATQTFTIATNNDDLVEGSETFTVTLGEDTEGGNDLPDGVTVGADDEATATITETDAATVTLSPLSPSVAEGGTFTFTATLSASVSEPVTVRWTAASGTATVTGAGSDLASGQATTATVTFPANSAANATQTFTIVTNNDDLVEGSETFTVTLSTDDDTDLPDGVTVGSADEATATITETDAATVTLSPLSPSVAEGGTFTFTATLSASVSEPVTVRWTAASGTATVDGAGSDLASGQATTATVTFPADSAANATQTFTIVTANDTRVEGSETFTVSIAADSSTPLPDGVEIGSADEATATITEDETATVSLSPLSPSVAEGGTFTFTATLSAPVSEPVTVRWTAASGTARVDGRNSDLASGQATTATVTFPANSAANATRTFTIATRNDAVAEAPETFTVRIAADPATPLPGGVEIGDADEATATITDAADATTVTLSPSSSSRAEGGTFSFTVTLNGSSSSPVTVRWRARASGNNPATLEGAASDLADGQAIGGRLVTFPANSPPGSRREIDIATRDDAVAEGDETFTVDILDDPARPLPTGVTIGDANEAIATITDAADAATVSLSPLSPSEAEGGTFTFTVALNRASSLPVTVRWTAASGTARVSGEDSDLADSQAVTGTVVFQANSTASQTFTIATRDDAVAEGDETFTVRIAADPDTALPPGVSIGDANEATATITDAADAATVSLSPLSPSEAEGGTFMFTVALNRASSLPVTVRWTAASGTARVLGEDSDLADGQAVTGTVIFQANSTASQTFTIATRDDAVAEGSETFTVRITADPDNALPPGVSIGDANEATATITDAADAATVSLSPLSPSVAEGGTFTFTVALNRASSLPVTVRWTAASGTARVLGEDSDLADGQALTGTVVFQANSTAAQTFTIATRDDAVAEGGETFTVRIAADPDTALPPGVSIGDANEATATITDAADAATVSLSPLSPSVAEGGTFTFTIALNRASSLPVTVRWTAASGTAVVDGPDSDLADGQAAIGSVIFRANSAANATQTFTIATRDDAVAEGDETFTVSIAAHPVAPLPPWITIGGDDEATATIEDDDDDGPEPSVLIEPRRIGAGTALRRHVSRFDTMTGTVVRGRLRGSGMKALSFAEDMKNGRMAAGGQLGKTRLGAWVNGAYGDLGGKATGRQADIYGGFDFLGGNGKWLIGALAGHEMADLEIGKATYSASYTHLGLYGGVRLSDRLVFDGALTYGMATPEVTLGDVSASYDANRITARIALTGDFGLTYGLGTGSVKVEPQVGLLYSREALGAFTDSAGGVAGREVLELGRFSFGPRLTWDFDWGQVVGGARVQWDFLQLEDGVDGRLSGAADIGLRFSLAPGVTLDLQGDVDGIGIAEGFRSFGGAIGLQFDLAPDVTLGLQGNVDGIGITDDSRDLGSKGVGVGGRVQLGVRF